MLCTGSIASVKFAVSGADTAVEDSCVTVVSHEMLRGDEPYPYGVYDARLGTTGAYRCQTCHNNKNTCIGHEGDIKLVYPVINPIAIEEIPKWLKAICHNCGESMVPESKYNRFPKKVRLDKMPSETKGKTKKCKRCDAYHPYVKRDDNSKFVFVAEVSKIGEKIAEKSILYPHQIAKIFSRISDETVIKFGKPIESHPRNFIIDVIKVPAVSVRPDVRKLSGGQTNNDDITTLLQDIIKKNSIMPREIPEIISEKLGTAIMDLSEQYFRLVRDSGEKSVNSIVNRLKGKSGRFRKNQMGKRVRNMCRSTITGDPTIPIDVVRIPLVFAQRIQLEDVVQEYNKHILMKLVRNGPVYPGASKIRKRLTNIEYDIVPGHEIEVEIGDTVIRDVLDGDDVGFNRAPSLGPSSIGAHKVLVTRDPKIRTIQMNVIDCKLYDADFRLH
jgi:DNA-directed RNA polymerase beta' subunit